MRELLQNVLSNYEAAYEQPYTDHPLGNLIKHIIPSEVAKLIID